MLELQSISKTFHPGTIHAKKALQNLSLSLNDGDFVTVIGGNGAGKSTLLNAIAGGNTTASGLDQAAAGLIPEAAKNAPEGTAAVELTFVTQILPESYQNGVLVLEKKLEDCTVSGQQVSVRLTEEDTLAFRQDGSVLQIQLRCGIGEKRLASEVITATVGRILKEGTL